MTTRCSLAILFTVLFAGCATVPPAKKPYIDLATWNSPSREKVYDACLTALHMQGYTLYPLGTSRENGLLVTENRHLSSRGGQPGAKYVWYKLQILVIKNSETQVTLSVKVSAGYPDAFRGGGWSSMINNAVSDDMKALFDEIGTLLGPAVHVRCEKVLEFE